MHVLDRQFAGATAEQVAQRQPGVDQMGVQGGAGEHADLQVGRGHLDIAVPAAQGLGQERRAVHPNPGGLAEGRGQVLRRMPLGRSATSRSAAPAPTASTASNAMTARTTSDERHAG